MAPEQPVMEAAISSQATGAAPPHRLSARTAATLAWTLWAAYAVLAAFSLILESVENPAGFSFSVLGDLVGLAYMTVGALIAARRPDNAIGWLFLAAAFLIIVSVFMGSYAVYALVTRPGALPGGEVIAWIAAWSRDIGFLLMFTFLLLLFPSGKLLSRRWRPLAWAAAVTIVLFTVSAALRPGPLSFARKISNPYGLTAAADAMNTFRDLVAFGGLLTIAGCVGAVVVRFRRARGEERQQLKWFAYAALLAGGILVGKGFLPVEIPPDLDEITLMIAVVVIPLAVGIAIFRHGLFDIDLIINRTLVYVPLTAILAGLYAILDMGLDKLFLPITESGSEATTVLTTLIIAASFTPVKNAIQDVVDKYFKEAPDATKKLKAFHEQVRSEFCVVDPYEITRRLLAEAVGAFKAETGALYLQEDGRLRLVHAHGEWNEAQAQVRLPLPAGGEQIGQLALGPRRDDQPYTDKDRTTLQEVSDSVVAAIRRDPPPFHLGHEARRSGSDV